MARTWLAGWLSLSVAWLLHEITTFGFIHGFLTGERNKVFLLSPFEVLGVNAILAALLAVPLAGVAYFRTLARPLTLALGALWLGTCFFGYFGTAFEYRSLFGMTWRPYEPFLELMWSPWLTPFATLTGLSLFMWAIRRPGKRP